MFQLSIPLKWAIKCTVKLPLAKDRKSVTCHAAGLCTWWKLWLDATDTILIRSLWLNFEVVLVIILDKMSYRMHHEVARRAFFTNTLPHRSLQNAKKCFFTIANNIPIQNPYNLYMSGVSSLPTFWAIMCTRSTPTPVHLKVTIFQNSRKIP